MKRKEEINKALTMRLAEVMVSVKAVNKSKFANDVGYSYSTLVKIINGERNVPTSLIIKICDRYPHINRKWFETGEGNMIVPESAKYTKPRLPAIAMAGSLASYLDSVSQEDCEQMPVVKQFPNYDFTIIIKGDSMIPEFKSGDEVACRRIESMIEYGRVYVVATNEGAVLKRVYDAGNCYRLVSYNKEYQDYLVNKADVYGIYSVVGLIRI